MIPMRRMTKKLAVVPAGMLFMLIAGCNAKDVGRGEIPPPLAEKGASEIRSVTRASVQHTKIKLLVAVYALATYSIWNRSLRS